MSITVIPTSQTLSSYRERVQLDGVTFALRFRWNTRLESWFFDIEDKDGNVLVHARRVVIDWLILRQNRHTTGVPTGQVLAFDTTQRDIRPLNDDFGTRVLLAYLDQAEVSAL